MDPTTSPPRPKKFYRILAFDGGGVRGAFSITLIERLMREPGFGDLIKNADLIAGTSTGGIITIGLAAGLTPTQLKEFYRTESANIFSMPFPFNQPWLRSFSIVRQLFVALYGNAFLKKKMNETLGSTKRLADLNKRVVVTSFNLHDQKAGRWKAKIFHNFPDHPMQKSDGEELAADVALRTSAAPTYFPFYGSYVDGGVAANNPSMCALAQALNPETGDQDLPNVAVFSVGTGLTKPFIKYADAPWGAGRWIVDNPRITDLLVDGNVEVAEYQCRQILRGRFHRLNPPLAETYTLDDAAQIEEIIAAAESVPLNDDRPVIQQHDDYDPIFSGTLSWLKYYWFGDPSVAQTKQ